LEITIFILFSLAATAAVLASPVSLFKRHQSARSRYCDERGEIILLNDLHRTTFRKH
jgi:hypothetical protein